MLLQTLGTYQSDHVTPPAGIIELLNGSTYQQALGGNPYYAPQSFQYTLPDIFFQLDSLGAHSHCRYLTACFLVMHLCCLECEQVW